MKRGTRGEASVHVAAGPEAVYEVVADVTRMGDWSPETVRCEWIDGAVGPVVGARFKGVNQRGRARWSTKPRIVAADPGREFAFVVPHFGRDLTKWTYHFDGTRDGTTVIESFEMLGRLPWYFVLTDRVLMGVEDRQADLEQAMRHTLDHLKAAVEGTAPAR